MRRILKKKLMDLHTNIRDVLTVKPTYEPNKLSPFASNINANQANNTVRNPSKLRDIQQYSSGVRVQSSVGYDASTGSGDHMYQKRREHSCTHMDG